VDPSLNKESPDITLGVEYLETETNLSSKDTAFPVHECKMENHNELI
jgi:hypothetical protein